MSHTHLAQSQLTSRESRNVISFRLEEHIQAVPQRFLSTLLSKCCNSKMRTPKPHHRTRYISNGKRLVLNERCVFSLVRNIVPLDTSIRHLRVKVRRVAKRRDGVHVFDGAHSGVCPGVDGVGRRGRGRLIRIFPPKLHVIVLVI